MTINFWSSRPVPAVLPCSDVFYKINRRNTRFRAENKPRLASFSRSSLFSFSISPSSCWPDPVEMLISCRLKATVLSSKSFLWDETEYLPAGVSLRPCLGLLGLLWHSQTGYLRNVVQTWLELDSQQPELCGHGVVTPEGPFDPRVSAGACRLYCCNAG